jgi:hypothetical protein
MTIAAMETKGVEVSYVTTYSPDGREVKCGARFHGTGRFQFECAVAERRRAAGWRGCGEIHAKPGGQKLCRW